MMSRLVQLNLGCLLLSVILCLILFKVTCHLLLGWLLEAVFVVVLTFIPKH